MYLQEYLWILKSFEVKSDDKFWSILGVVNFLFGFFMISTVGENPHGAICKNFELDKRL